MSDQYDKIIANHYSAYRPPLHQMILENVLTKEQVFTTGADIGCGTGYSAIALTKYCTKVYGIEPSQSMLDKAVLHDQITYLLGSSNKIPIPENSLDVVTFAGSLFYAKSEFLIKELRRVCKKHSIIICYDFEVVLDTVVLHFGLRSENTLLDYNYEVNFEEDEGFEEIINGRQQISLPVTALKIAHILLSEARLYNAFLEKYDQKDPFPTLVEELENTNLQRTLNVNVYFSKYRLMNE